MDAIKERIVGAVSIMDEDAAKEVWNFIIDYIPKHTWSDIKEVEPDDWDKSMIKEIETDPDCKEFVSEADALKELGLE
ncbi:hypothetical protein KQI69_02470 [Eubacterium sp. MSJ-13]|uniref:hypothetical protein n=1 Tax=Eubacterium sp. MSJ-13 TaxID=2841513 RepID=UPI001C11F1CE|nr:hypothetical protein [Eubacterium sp. MSJ-13]MBU5478060.1 hypothetical protein [Eubacterium sp. MSJ-13]